MKVTVELEGLPELLDHYRGVEVGMLDFRTLGTWDKVQTEFYKVVWSQFTSEGGDGKSGKWQALSPRYAKRKDAKWGSMPILQASGRLWRSLTGKGTDSVAEQSALELVLGTKVPYAKYHQTGTKAPARRAGGRAKGFVGPVLNLMGPQRGGMPARPPIDFTEEQERQLMKPIQQHLRQIVSQAKLTSLRG
jgi:phage gpG-like protein